jgi:DNA-binding IclR family transcriptional regulator
MPKSAERVMRILDLCAAAKEGLRNVQIAQVLNIPTGSLSILLSGMVNNGYLSLDPIGKRYTIGPQVLVLSSHYLSSIDIVEMGLPILKAIMAATEESASVSIRKGNEVLYVCKVDSTQPLSQVVNVGSRAPLHASAAGKIFLAHLSEEDLDKFLRSQQLNPVTPKTITDREKLKIELNKVRQEGIGSNLEELNEGIFALAAPIFDARGAVVAAVHVAVPFTRWNSAKENQVARSLKNASRVLSLKLGYAGKKVYWDSL